MQVAASASGGSSSGSGTGSSSGSSSGGSSSGGSTGNVGGGSSSSGGGSPGPSALSRAACGRLEETLSLVANLAHAASLDVDAFAHAVDVFELLVPQLVHVLTLSSEHAQVNGAAVLCSISSLGECKRLSIELGALPALSSLAETSSSNDVRTATQRALEAITRHLTPNSRRIVLGPARASPLDQPIRATGALALTGKVRSGLSSPLGREGSFTMGSSSASGAAGGQQRSWRSLVGSPLQQGSGPVGAVSAHCRSRAAQGSRVEALSRSSLSAPAHLEEGLVESAAAAARAEAAAERAEATAAARGYGLATGVKAAAGPSAMSASLYSRKPSTSLLASPASSPGSSCPASPTSPPRAAAAGQGAQGASVPLTSFGGAASPQSVQAANPP